MSLFAECEDVEDLCLDSIDGTAYGVGFEIILFLYAFVGIAVVADEHLTTALETLCHRWQIPEDVAGASFLAMGSAAPEIVVASVSTVKSILADDMKSTEFAVSLGISSILGSGMMAMTLIPALCAMAVPKPMELKRRPFARDVVFYLVSLVLLWDVIIKGHISLVHAVLMVSLYVVYLLATAFAPQVREMYRVRVCGMPPKQPLDLGSSNLEERLADGEKDDDDDDDEAESPVKAALFLPFKPMCDLVAWTCPACEVGSPTEDKYAMTLLMSLTWLTVFSTILSATVTRFGTLLNVPATAMGAFVVAVGAQIPDTIQAVAVARRGHGSMAVASAAGSQVVNVLVGLGLPWLLTAGAGKDTPMPSDKGLAHLNFMMVLTVGCVAVYLGVLLAPTVGTWGGEGKATLGRPQGYLLCLAYALVVAIFFVFMPR